MSGWRSSAKTSGRALGSLASDACTRSWSSGESSWRTAASSVGGGAGPEGALAAPGVTTDAIDALVHDRIVAAGASQRLD